MAPGRPAAQRTLVLVQSARDLHGDCRARPDPRTTEHSGESDGECRDPHNRGQSRDYQMAFHALVR